VIFCMEKYCLFVYSLLNDVVSNLVYIASDKWIIIAHNLEGSGGYQM
jgi:hypothetical protein